MPDDGLELVYTFVRLMKTGWEGLEGGLPTRGWEANLQVRGLYMD